ncbi:MAG: hypothetical protein Q9P14_19030 [candidate division KSB1 bacterium]|nr:hypothetical protein [candidate division KSB1 bacterium]MDQ7065024.1 hypothetical protein [candidate division KSB1 bacterium]
MRGFGHVMVMLFGLLTMLWLAPSEQAFGLYGVSVYKKDMLNLYLDCRGCYREYIRTELNFVNYVRNREDADVHVLITRRRTGSGGREYTLVYLGRGVFGSLTDTLKAVSSNTDTEDEIRQNLLRILKMGLMRFIAHTDVSQFIDIRYTRHKTAPAQAIEDRWNYWVFRISADGRFRGESSSKFFSLNGSFSANRITEAWKIRLHGNAGYDQSDFDIGGGKISSFSRRYFVYGVVVKSMGEHFSAGAYVFSQSSTYDNIQFSVRVAPAVEYNLFPYSESTHRELRIQYRIGTDWVRYFEETIFDKLRENLYGQQLEVTYETRQPWGDAEFSLEGSHLLNDFSKNRLRVSGELRLRLFRGFSLRLDGNFSFIRDQLSLPKGEASTEEVLLRRRQLATSFRYWGAVGISFTFGSIYNNIVNTRFGN